MFRSRIKQFAKYSLVVGALAGTVVSLKGNQYELDSIGVVRLTRAAITVFKIGVIYKKDLLSKNLEKDSVQYKELKSKCHKLSAEKLLELCCLNKGVYIKVGQHIAALDYLIPTEYVQTLKILHSNAPTNKLEDVYKVIRADLKKDPLEIFETFDPVPLGTASLAQVHKATLKDGSVVAVKVQHPYVQGNSLVDMKTMETLVKIMSWVFPDFKFQWLVDESKKNIPQELDFVQEGKNAEKVSELFKDYDWLKIPSIRWDMTTSRVLTMDFEEGGQVNDLNYIKRNNINAYEVSDKLGKLYSQMIFINGFVHSDPHPGNILVKKNENGHCNIILLDHGLYAKLKDEVRVEYANLWLSILNKDRASMKEHAKNLGIDGNLYGLFVCMVAGRPWEAVLKGVDNHEPNKAEKDFFQHTFAGILPQISDILQNVNRQMLLILKANDLLRSIEYTLKTSARHGAFCVMSECCVKSVYNQKYSDSNKRFEKFKLSVVKYWTLFKINFYYTYLTLKSSLYIL